MRKRSISDVVEHVRRAVLREDLNLPTDRCLIASRATERTRLWRRWCEGMHRSFGVSAAAFCRITTMRKTLFKPPSWFSSAKQLGSAQRDGR